MPTWGQILNEINGLVQAGDQAAFDTVRKKYVAELAAFTGRDLIIYVSRWTQADSPPQLTMINDEDVQGFMEAVNGLRTENLDIMLHTPGGSAESTDAIVSYLRQKFKHIRIIIPQAAMSAGTMFACAADEIIMAKHSSIGPIDPQMVLQTPLGVQAIAAHAITEQFERAQKEISANPAVLSSWLPMLNQYGPALLIQCKNQIEFGKQLVQNWLDNYMFKNDTAKLGMKISEYLSHHGNFKTHCKHLNTEAAKALGLKIIELEQQAELQEKVLSVFHACLLTFNLPQPVKIICNHVGNAFVKQKPLQMPFGLMQGQPGPIAPQPSRPGQ